MPIPKEIEKTLVQISKEQWEIEKEKNFQRSLKFYKKKIENNNDLMELVNNKLSKKIEEKVDSFLESFFFNKGRGSEEILQKNSKIE